MRVYLIEFVFDSGVSDVLVTKCNEPRCTPIASTSCPSDLTLDDFDIDNLFFSTKPLLDEKCASDKVGFLIL